MEVIHRIPTGLWDNLQELVWRMDASFLRDVSQITKIPLTDLRKVVPVRGLPTRLITEDGNEPWWTGLSCRMMVRGASGMWVRCSGTAFEGACCFKHRDIDGRRRGKLPGGVLPYDDPYFATLVSRVPVRIEGVVYWADEDGGLYNIDGLPVDRMTVNISEGIVCLVTKE
jgi:hypothetical protein